MRKLLTGCAAIALVTIAVPAGAQTYNNANNPKDHDTTLNQSKYVEPAPQKESEAQQAASVEPAAGNYESHPSFNGPYIGGQFGYDWAHAGVTDPTGPSGTAHMRGFAGGPFVGYGMTFGEGRGMFSGMYLGGELGYDWSGADDDVGGNNYKLRHDFRATVRPGATFGNTLGYGIAGYSRATYDADVNGEDEGFNGYVLGLGAEAGAFKMLKARLEYTYAHYADKDIGGIEFQPHSNEIRLGVLYQFQ